MKIKNKRLFLLIFVLVIVFNTTSYLLIAEGQHDTPVSIDEIRTRFETGKKYINEPAKLTVAIDNEGENDTSVMVRVIGEYYDITPEGNQTYYVQSGYSSSTFNFYLYFNETGTFLTQVELYYEGELAALYPLSVDVEEEIILPPSMVLVFWIYLLAGLLIYIIYIKKFILITTEKGGVAAFIAYLFFAYIVCDIN